MISHLELSTVADNETVKRKKISLILKAFRDYGRLTW